MNDKYSLQDIEKAIYGQLVETHSTYKYMTDFVWPLLKQQSLCDAYPAILRRLDNTARQAIILGLGKLLEVSQKGYRVNFKKFLDAASSLSISDIQDREAWSQFQAKSKNFLDTLLVLENRLKPLRNRYWAHLCPGLPAPKEKTTWQFWFSKIEEMENILIYILLLLMVLHHHFALLI